MVNNIRESFIEMLDENKWMSDEVRRKAEEKALLMDLRIGFPKELLEENKMDSFLGYVCFTIGQTKKTIFTKLYFWAILLRELSQDYKSMNL
jgi:hypothetical protein